MQSMKDVISMGILYVDPHLRGLSAPSVTFGPSAAEIGKGNGCATLFVTDWSALDRAAARTNKKAHLEVGFLQSS
jgi:hypothetical protein